MRISLKMREEFLAQFNGEQIKRKDVEVFLSPYLDFNAEDAHKDALAKAAREFLSSFRDDKQVRECLAFEIEGQRAFAFIDSLELHKHLPVLKAMKGRLEKQIAGCIKSKTKVEARMWIIENQITIDDMIQQNQSKLKESDALL